jgi:hypothetical protein
MVCWIVLHRSELQHATTLLSPPDAISISSNLCPAFSSLQCANKYNHQQSVGTTINNVKDLPYSSASSPTRDAGVHNSSNTDFANFLSKYEWSGATLVLCVYTDLILIHWDCIWRCQTSLVRSESSGLQHREVRRQLDVREEHIAFSSCSESKPSKRPAEADGKVNAYSWWMGKHVKFHFNQPRILKATLQIKRMTWHLSVIGAHNVLS